MNNRRLLAFLAFALSFPAKGQDVQVLALWVEMPQENLTSLLSSGTEGDKLLKTARELVIEMRAKVFDTVVQRLQAGEQALAELIVEIRAPTEPTEAMEIWR